MAFRNITRKPLRNLFIIPSLIVIGIIFIAWLMTPFVARHYLQEYFQSQGESASLQHLRVHFFPPRVTIKNLTVTKEKQDTLTLKELDLGINLSPLLSGTIRVSHAKIDGLTLSVKQQKNDWIIAGINLDQYQSKAAKEQTSNAPKTEKNSTPWTIEVPQFSFVNSHITLSRQTDASAPIQQDTVLINKLSINDLVGKGMDWQGSVQLNTNINTAKIDLASQFHYTPTKGQASLTIQDTLLPLQAFTHFIPAPYQTGKGDLSLQGTLTASLKKNNGTTSYQLNDSSLTASLKALDLPLPEQSHASLAASTLALSNLSASYDSQNNISTKGNLNIQLSGLTTKLKDKQSATVAKLSVNTPFNVAQHDQALTANTPKANIDLQKLTLSLSSLALTNEQSTLALSQLQLSKSPTDSLQLSVKSQLDSHNLSAEQADIKTHYDTLSLTNTSSFSQTQNSDIKVNNNDINLTLSGLTAQQKNKADVSLGQMHIAANTLNVDLANHQKPHLIGTDINLITQAFDAKLSDTKRAASWYRTSLSHVNLNQHANDFDVSLNKLNIQKLIVSEPLTSKTSQPASPALATIDDVAIDQIHANQDGVRIKQIDTKGVKGNLLLDSKKRIENLVFVDTNDQKVPSEKAKPINAPKQQDIVTKKQDSNKASTDSTFKAPYYVILDAYNMTGKSSLYIQDKSIDPALNRTLTIEKFAIRNLNTKDKKQKATLDFKARNDKYSTISGDVAIFPLANKLTMSSHLVVSQAELPPYSPYIANVLGYQIDSGQLNLDLKLTSKEGVINGTSHIVLKQFDLGGAYQSSSVIKTGVIPLNIAVGVLKNGDGNIDLNIPLSGNIDNPQFGWGDFLVLPIKKALFKASSNYLLQTFVPYANVISIAQFAGEQLLKIRVEPLKFKAKQTDLSADQDTFLKQLTDLMKDKKDSELRACGVASYQDLGLEKPPVTISNAARQAANAIATKRANSLKDYLVSQKISSSRIFICAPEVDLSRGSTPRIDLNF
ncbi:hypothetical protein MSP8886_03800 [Marinomonas spartinae]|uniref:AsmA family protein n=1 Tax=Marinomonas spartinae TaxID=1792290 RepID=A0A1A8TU42_9GAMM|nr:DUF748 domain-containing protein [Marinomonas spartinae]SBS36672.1 hypothetical protein MSP8886_03800 [Marinomonas spartinae]